MMELVTKQQSRNAFAVHDYFCCRRPIHFGKRFCDLQNTLFWRTLRRDLEAPRHPIPERDVGALMHCLDGV